jgi:predicted transposase YbfD/YdcC
MENKLDGRRRARLESLRDDLGSIGDVRQPGRTLHPLGEVLFCSLCSTLCGFGHFTSMAEFTRLQIGWLRQFVALENGAPSHDVFRNVFLALKPEALVGILARWAGGLEGAHVAVDGKTQRAARPGGAEGSSVHVLRAWVDERSVSAGQVACAAKSNEIEAIPRLLAGLELRGATVTIDAAGCQRQVAADIHAAGAAYVLALKANQPQAFGAVAAHFAGGAPGAFRHQTEERSRGRYEKREYALEADLGWFSKSWKWEGLGCVAHVRRTVLRQGAAGTDGREPSVEDHYYLCSIPPDVGILARLARGHWGVENRCHWTLDVTFGEDKCGLRDPVASRNLSCLREMAIHLLRSHPSASTIPLKQMKAALDPDFRLAILLGFDT